MCLLIWQVLVVTCLSSLFFCGSAFKETGQRFAEKLRDKMFEEEDLGMCPTKNSKYPILIPHPAECSKFFICDSGTPHLQICEAGLHFNPKIKACDFPSQAGCEEDNGVTEDPSGSDEDDSDGCPAKNSKHPIYIPHPTDCNKFYICDSGSPHLQTCQTGLHFNTKINACDFPDRAGCYKGVTEDPGHLDDDDDDDSDGCPSKNSKHPIYIPHPTDCSKFYICDSGSPHLQTCQAGLHFNKKIKACDFPDNAGCDKEVTEDPDELIDEDNSDGCPAKNSEHPVYIPHPIDCNKFYICDSGSPHLQTCQDGLHFNMKVKACDFPDKAGCDKGIPNVLSGAGVRSPFCPPVTTGKKDVFYRSASNCSIFYMCSNGFAYEFVCPARLHFNLRKKQCDYEDEARCYSINT